MTDIRTPMHFFMDDVRYVHPSITNVWKLSVTNLRRLCECTDSTMDIYRVRPDGRLSALSREGGRLIYISTGDRFATENTRPYPPAPKEAVGSIPVVAPAAQITPPTPSVDTIEISAAPPVEETSKRVHRARAELPSTEFFIIDGLFHRLPAIATLRGSDIARLAKASKVAHVYKILPGVWTHVAPDACINIKANDCFILVTYDALRTIWMTLPKD